MRLRIDTSTVRFRVAGTAKPKQVKGAPGVTPDGRPIWVVKLTAMEPDRNTSETIWVEVAGDEPKLTLDDLVQARGLVFAPWISKTDHKIVRSFRADSIEPSGPAKPVQAA